LITRYFHEDPVVSFYVKLLRDKQAEKSRVNITFLAEVVYTNNCKYSNTNANRNEEKYNSQNTKL